MVVVQEFDALEPLAHLVIVIFVLMVWRVVLLVIIAQRDHTLEKFSFPELVWELYLQLWGINGL